MAAGRQMCLDLGGRPYRQVEMYVWRDLRFKALSDDGKLLWLHLETTPAHQTIACEGLMECNAFTMARYLGWLNGDLSGVQAAVDRVRAALQPIADLGWVACDVGAELVLLPHAIRRHPPANPNVLTQWIRALRSVPQSVLRAQWVRSAAEALRQRFGRDDARAIAVGTILQSMQQHAQAIDAAEGEQRQATGFYRGYGAGGDDHVSTAIAAWSSGATAEHKPRKSRSPRKAKPKPEDPPAHFTARQRELWAKFRTVRFIVPGAGEQTVWENVANPVGLCERLGGDGYPNVDAGLIDRLAAWTHEKPTHAKPRLNLFLINRFGATQERGGTRPGSPAAAALGSGAAPRASAERPLNERM